MLLEVVYEMNNCNDVSLCQTSDFIVIKPDTPINVYAQFCLSTAKSKFSLVSPVAD